MTAFINSILIVLLKADISDPRLWKGLLAFSVIVLVFYLITKAEKSIDKGEANAPIQKSSKEVLEFYVAIDKYTDEFVVALDRDFSNQSISQKVQVQVQQEAKTKFQSDYCFRQSLIPTGKRFNNIEHCANYVKLALTK